MNVAVVLVLFLIAFGLLAWALSKCGFAPMTDDERSIPPAPGRPHIGEAGVSYREPGT